MSATPVEPTPAAAPVEQIVEPAADAAAVPEASPTSNPEDALDPHTQKVVDAIRGDMKVERGKRQEAEQKAAQAGDAAKAELAQTIGKALGLIADDEPVDPGVLTEQLTTANQQAKQAQTELAVFRAATAASADATALLDSRSFMARLAEIDPSDHLAITAAIGDAVTANPAFAVQANGKRLPGPNPAQGSSASGAPNLDAQIADAKAKGDVSAWMHLENQKLTAARQ